jgi:hypothetical protein
VSKKKVRKGKGRPKAKRRKPRVREDLLQDPMWQSSADPGNLPYE